MSWQNIAGVFLIGAVGVGMATGTYLSVTLKESDSSAVCSADAHTMVAVDRTDPLTPAQRVRFRIEMDRVLASLATGERLTIIPIEETVPSPLKPILSLCRPPDGSDAHWLYDNKKFFMRDFEAGFGLPLASATAMLEEPAQSPQSPILQTIKAIAELPTFASSVGRRRLIIISDMLENTTAYSQYRDGAQQYEQFHRSVFARQVSTTLEGVAVRVVYLRNEQAVRHQVAMHRTFWQRYFESSGARVEGLS